MSRGESKHDQEFTARKKGKVVLHQKQVNKEKQFQLVDNGSSRGEVGMQWVQLEMVNLQYKVVLKMEIVNKCKGQSFEIKSLKFGHCPNTPPPPRPPYFGHPWGCFDATL